MNCERAEPLLHAQLDGELELTASLEMERHLAECDACANRYRRLERLREELAAVGLDWSAETDLRPLRTAIRRDLHGARWPWRGALAVAATLVVAVFFGVRFSRPNDALPRQVIDDHVRSLLGDHLVDVPSSDRHTVKPWFQGKLGFSPPAPDLSDHGFELAGGRLDVIAGRPAAAIVYRRHNHVVNLLVSRAAGSGPEFTSLDGYNLEQWHSGGMTYWAASDLNAAELREFCDLVRARGN